MPRRFYGEGEVFILAWEPPLEEVERALIETYNYLNDTTPVLLAARRIAMDDMQEHFVNEEDPGGTPWVELSEEYADRKSHEGFGQHILVRETTLVDAATSEAAWVIIGENLVFNSSVLPPYGTWHQTGKERKKGGTLPARPFIGLSEEAETKVFTVFRRWATEAETIYIRPSGRVQIRYPKGSGKGGQFGPHLFDNEF